VENIAPDDFESIFRTNGFDSAFGTVYLNRKTKTLGFRVTQYLACHEGNRGRLWPSSGTQNTGPLVDAKAWSLDTAGT